MGADDRSVSIVLPVRNEERHIDASIRSIRDQTHPDVIEIIVVDGDSADATRAIVQGHIEEDSRVTLLDNPERSMSHALNIGIRAATAAYVGVAIGHAVLPPDYVARAIATLERTGAWGVGGRMVRRATTARHRAIAIATSSRIGVGDSSHNVATQSGWSESAFPGFWRREVFENVGLFDTDVLVNEDNELSHRIKQAGGRIWFDASIQIEYVPRSSLASLWHQYRRYAIGRMHVLRKHRGGLRWRHFVPGGWMLILVAGAAASLALPALRGVWLGTVAFYLIVIGLFSVRLAARGAPWWLIAAALVTLHTAYGLGTWQGVLSWFTADAGFNDRSQRSG